jgi:hypothetical protein
MNKEMLKTLVKQHFNLIEAVPTPETQTFAEASLVDGTKVSNDEGADFAIGQTLFVTTEDGSKVIAPVGLHTTESGIAIDVDAEGKIVGIHHPDMEPEGSLAIATETEAAAEQVAMAEHGDKMAEHEVGDIIEAVVAAVRPEIEMLKQKMADMEEQMKKVFSAPASEKTQTAKFGKEEAEKQTIADPINAKMAKMAVDALKAKKK